jgi:threonine/homoserine/homoserine lactone efflux protein
MPDSQTMTVFLIATFALLVVPGPAVLYIVARGIDQGRGAALASAVGISAGSVVHVILATLGLSALVASSEVAFNTLKWIGALYLVYMGIRTLMSSPPSTLEPPPAAPFSSLFGRGMVVQILNPKIALFFLAFLPQFVDPARGSVALQTLALGLILVAMGLCTDSTYGLLAGMAGNLLRSHAGFINAQRWVAGTVFIGLGILTAFTGSHTKS